MMTERIESLIVGFIQDELTDGVAVDAIDRDENLFASGVVDSVGIVRLIAYLKEQLGVSVPPTDLIPENFRTIRVMATYMHGLVASST